MKRSDILKESLVNFLRVMGDLMVLNWLWVICSLPIVTIGPATCALYAVTLRLCRGEDCAPVRDFFRAFKLNLKPGFILGLMALALAVVGLGDTLFAMEQSGALSTVYVCLAFIIGAVLLTILCYAIPLQAMFDAPLSQQLKNAFSLPFVSPGRTLKMWLILIFPAAALLLPKVIIGTLGFLYLIMGFSGPAYMVSRDLRIIFDKVNGAPVIPPAEENAEN